MEGGAVAFGLVSVPIKLHAATEDHDVRFHQVHTADGGRVKILRTCSVDGQPREAKDLSKAYEMGAGELVVMEDADVEELPVPGVKEIEVLEFVPTEQVDPMMCDRSYYLEPEAGFGWPTTGLSSTPYFASTGSAHSSRSSIPRSGTLSHCGRLLSS